MNVSIANLFKVPEIRNKILFTLGLLFIYRIGFYIPLPGVNADKIFEGLGSTDGVGRLFGMMNVLTGGSLQSATLFSLGVMPYISASIIFSLLTKAVPTLEKIAKDFKILVVTFHAVRRFHAPGAMRWEGVLTPYNGIPP